MKKRNWVYNNLLLLLFTFIMPVFVFAQDIDYKGEIYGNVGYGRLFDDETNLGTGLVVGGGIGYRFNRRWAVTFDVSRIGHQRETESYIFEGYALLVGGGLQYHFRPESKAQPYIRLGLSFAHYDGATIGKPFLPPPGFPPVPGFVENGTQNFLGPDIGVGVKIFVTKKISIRPEYSFAIHGGFHAYDPPRDILEPGLWAPRFTVGIGYHW